MFPHNDIAVLDEIRKILETNQITWESKDVPNGKGCAFQGSHKDWLFLVVQFSIEDQGFPPDSMGYDGTATNLSKGQVIRLTRELAEELFENAQTD